MITDNQIKIIDTYWRAANYLGAAQIYLRDNCLLEKPLTSEHIKNRLLGHWGTVPGINFIYAHLNNLIREYNLNILLVTGPGHGAPANLANLFLEGSLEAFYPEYSRDLQGIYKLIRSFSIPGGFPSHLYPGTPGCIHEGGELGYALATSFGAAFDNPNLIVACIVGDGEAETGPTATAWHSTKFLNPLNDGVVLPILHLNHYKISSTTIYGSMGNDELLSLFHGYGYEPLIVDCTIGDIKDAHRLMAETLEIAYKHINQIKELATIKEDFTPRWPMLILRSQKGWTGPHEVDGKLVEGSYRSHQVPAKECKTNPAHLKAIEDWFTSYNLSTLFEATGAPTKEVLTNCPEKNFRMGMNPHAYGGDIRRDLKRPDYKKYCLHVERRGTTLASDMAMLGKYLRDVISLNSSKNGSEEIFRIFCPDELTSNRLEAVFESTSRQFLWPTGPGDESIARSGRVMEVLSEHNCQGWLQGYLLTGRHGLFPCYEAFAPIVDSMLNQYAKFIKVASEVSWRKPTTSLTYILTSEGWRQDHNGYSHQGPGFIDNLLTKKAKHVRIYLPPDANCLLSTIDHCLTSMDKINLVIASKQPMPQWLSPVEAEEHCIRGYSVWEWAGNANSDEPDVVLGSSGVYPTIEVLAAASILESELPELKVRVVNVTDLLVLELETFHPHGLTPETFNEVFTVNRPVIFNFHGYPNAVKQLLFNRPELERFHINGYIEEGTTTTPFDLLIRNKASRYHVVIQAATQGATIKKNLTIKANSVIEKYKHKILEHRTYIETHGVDPKEITEWHHDFSK